MGKMSSGGAAGSLASAAQAQIQAAQQAGQISQAYANYSIPELNNMYLQSVQNLTSYYDQGIAQTAGYNLAGSNALDSLSQSLGLPVVQGGTYQFEQTYNQAAEAAAAIQNNPQYNLLSQAQNSLATLQQAITNGQADPVHTQQIQQAINQLAPALQQLQGISPNTNLQTLSGPLLNTQAALQQAQTLVNSLKLPQTSFTNTGTQNPNATISPGSGQSSTFQVIGPNGQLTPNDPAYQSIMQAYQSTGQLPAGYQAVNSTTGQPYPSGSGQSFTYGSANGQGNMPQNPLGTGGDQSYANYTSQNGYGTALYNIANYLTPSGQPTPLQQQAWSTVPGGQIVNPSLYAATAQQDAQAEANYANPFISSAAQILQQNTTGAEQQLQQIQNYIMNPNMVPTQGSDVLKGFANSGQGQLTNYNPNLSMVQNFQQSNPGYQFQLQQGQMAIQNAASAQGLLNNPNLLTQLSQYTTGYANQSFNQYQQNVQSALNSYQNQLASVAQGGLATGLANQGQASQTGSNLSSAGLTTGQNVAGVGTSLGNNLSNSALAQGSALGNYYTNLANLQAQQSAGMGQLGGLLGQGIGSMFGGSSGGSIGGAIGGALASFL